MTVGPEPSFIAAEFIARGQVDMVPPDSALAALYLAHADAHIRLAAAHFESDFVGAFQLAYDGARKSLASILIIHGFRATARGGHWALGALAINYLSEEQASIVKEFAWMRALRNATEYPTAENPVAARDDCVAAIRAAQRIHEVAASVVDSAGKP